MMMNENIRLIKKWQKKVSQLSAESHRILSKVEDSQSRVVLLDKTSRRLKGLPIDVESYFSESIKCLGYDLRRPAIVLAWAGFFHILAEYSFKFKESDIRLHRPNWKFLDFLEFKEKFSEAQILDVFKEVGVVKNAELRIYQGQLSTRNQCAHPTLYNPSLNSAIGFTDDMIVQSLKYILVYT